MAHATAVSFSLTVRSCNNEIAAALSYELSRPVILNALKNSVGLPQVTVEDSPAVAEALDLFETGMDFADALHLASSREAAHFATFDERLKKRADEASPGRRVVLA